MYSFKCINSSLSIQGEYDLPEHLGFRECIILENNWVLVVMAKSFRFYSADLKNTYDFKPNDLLNGLNGIAAFFPMTHDESCQFAMLSEVDLDDIRGEKIEH